jgi:hypothetical protein
LHHPGKSARALPLAQGAAFGRLQQDDSDQRDRDQQVDNKQKDFHWGQTVTIWGKGKSQWRSLA